MNKSIKISILLYFLLSVSSFANDKGFKISITVSGAENSFLTIGYHLGDKQYIKDTIITNESGTGIYTGSNKLEQGLYIVLLPDNRYFDIIVDTDQDFSLNCSIEDIVGTMIVSGSEENNNFIEYQRMWISLQSKSRLIKARLQNNSQNEDSTTILRKHLTDHETGMIVFLKETSNQNPNSFLSLLVRALIPLDIPQFDIPESSSNPDSLRWVMGYNYNLDHFFDNTNLADSRLIRTPILYGKLKTYFSKILIQHPDSINKRITRVVDIAEQDSAMFRYMVVFLFNHFRESTIMGHDGVTVKIIDDYYLSGRADWISDETFKSLSEDAARLRPNLIGKKAVNLIMDTYVGIPQSVYDIKSAYTILYFWEPNCGHCKTSTPQLKELYEKYDNPDFEIFAICTQGSKEEWESYIADNGLTWINGWDPDRTTNFDFYYNVNATPLVYILDYNKNIIAKKISVENIEDFLTNHRKQYR